MKPFVGWVWALVALVGTALPLGVQAQHHDRGWRGDIRHFGSHDVVRWRSGHWHHGSHGGRLGWWWVMGGAWYWYPQPVYPFPDPYRPPVVVIESAPVVVQVPAPLSAPAAAVQPAPAVPQFWYYCEPAKAYYPYVATCPTGWQAVPATPATGGTQ